MPNVTKGLRFLSLSLLLAPLCACVSRARYEEALDSAQYYQRQLHDLNSFQGELEARNAELAGELEIYRAAGTVEAAMTEEIDARMEDLEKMAGRIGGATGDVTVLAVEGGYGLRLSDAILFDSGQATVRADGLALLERMAAEIAGKPYVRVWVRGHSDSDPVTRAATLERFPHGNLQLSASRAIEVAAILGDSGVERERLVVAGFGPSDPVLPNTSGDNKQKNRRVDIFVIEDEAAPASR